MVLFGNSGAARRIGRSGFTFKNRFRVQPSQPLYGEFSMVDFNALMGSNSKQNTTNPLEIFEELPKSSRINDLYNVQAEILRKWYESMRNEKNVIIELNTGGGKTLVGLLIALSTMRELGEGTLYLVENKQLADQVVDQATEMGIPAMTYHGRDSVNAAFDNGELILVAPYQALFNGKSVFGLRDYGGYQRISGVIIDDAHASLSAIRQTFSLIIPANDAASLYKMILGHFRQAFIDLNRMATYNEFMNGTGSGVVEIPFWHFLKSIDKITEIIGSEAQRRQALDDSFSNSLKFAWPLIRDNLKYCQVIVGNRGITIASLYPLLDMIPTFGDAKRRIFMSATITDYGDMVRAFDLRGLKDGVVIAPKTVAGVGRRMILSLPHDYSGKPEFSDLARELIANRQGLVRLVAKSGTDANWPSIKFYEPLGHEDVRSAVHQLQLRQCITPVSFVNRYNGIDLPGDSCRMLILRSLPYGSGDYEELMSAYLSDSDLMTQRIAQKIEQGLGRGVRGSSDYCVVLLEGRDLIDWIERNRNRRFFTPALRAQLEIGREIQDTIYEIEDFCETVRQGLSDDAGWQKYHAERLAQAVAEGVSDRFGESYKTASAERRAFACWVEQNHGRAQKVLEDEAERCASDPCYRGWLLHLASRIAYDNNEPKRAEQLQQQAHSFNRAIPYAPFGDSDSHELPDWALLQAERVFEIISGKTARLCLGGFDSNTAALQLGVDFKAFQTALMWLGRYLGFDSELADNDGDGPDVYWVMSDKIGFALEAKNQKGEETPFHKGEASQLRTSRDWLAQKYPDIEAIPVSVHPNALADSNASAANLFVLTLEKLAILKGDARRLLEYAAEQGENGAKTSIAHYIVECELGGLSVSKKYLERFENAQRDDCERQRRPR